MIIKELSFNECKNKACKNCNKIKGTKNDKRHVQMMYGVWASNNMKPDYVMCKNCMNTLLDCVSNLNI